MLACAVAAAPAFAAAGQLLGTTPSVHTRPLPPEYRVQADGSVRLRVCFNSSCARTEEMVFGAEEMARVRALMESCPAATLQDRLQRIRIGIWQMEVLAAEHQPLLRNDRAVNDQDIGVEGRTDCVDNATNTTTFLSVLVDLGALPGWTVDRPSVRRPLDLNRVHWTAVAVDETSRVRWAVDSWFRPHGHLPFVQPLADWRDERKAWEPPFAALNPYPRYSYELCSRP